MNSFRRGDAVTWVGQGWSGGGRLVGAVAWIVPRGIAPLGRIESWGLGHLTASKLGSAPPRDHASYLIATGRHLLWPQVGRLRLVDAGELNRDTWLDLVAVLLRLRGYALHMSRATATQACALANEWQAKTSPVQAVERLLRLERGSPLIEVIATTPRSDGGNAA